MSITFFFRPLIVALLLFEGGLQAQPLVETYKRQEELRLHVAGICYSQFETAQYHPAEGLAEDVRYMISAKGVQAIKAVVIPAVPDGSYKCARGRYEKPMLLGRTYRSQLQPLVALSERERERCLWGVRGGAIHPAECASVRKERLELEPCVVLIGDRRLTTSCLISYTQFDNGLVERQTLAFRRLSQSE